MHIYISRWRAKLNIWPVLIYANAILVFCCRLLILSWVAVSSQLIFDMAELVAVT